MEYDASIGYDAMVAYDSQAGWSDGGHYHGLGGHLRKRIKREKIRRDDDEILAFLDNYFNK